MAGDGKKDDVKGRMKEAAGALLDDDDLKNEGRADRAAGDLEEKAGRLIDQVEDAVTGKDSRK